MTAHLEEIIELKFFNFFLNINFKKQTRSTLILRMMGHFIHPDAVRTFAPV
tara:strand:- start:36286 stop:36438 length:153 start_codon:yes stop_codon:yes gene_type:complete